VKGQVHVEGTPSTFLTTKSYNGVWKIQQGLEERRNKIGKEVNSTVKLL
jgi:hypothetical protein